MHSEISELGVALLVRKFFVAKKCRHFIVHTDKSATNSLSGGVHGGTCRAKKRRRGWEGGWRPIPGPGRSRSARPAKASRRASTRPGGAMQGLAGRRRCRRDKPRPAKARQGESSRESSLIESRRAGLVLRILIFFQNPSFSKPTGLGLSLVNGRHAGK